MAYDVIAILQGLATSGRTVICTVHQPSFKLFSCFDRLILLNAGRVAFAGVASAAVPYFTALGFATPLHENPAEYLCTLLGEPLTIGESSCRHVTQGSSFCAVWAQQELAVDDAEQGAAPPQASIASLVVDESINSTTTTTTPAVRQPSSRRPSALSRCLLLVKRELHDQIKDPRKLLQSLLLRLAVGLLVGLLFLNQGRRQSYESIFPTTSAIFIAIFNCNMDTLLDTLLKQPQIRSLLKREYANGMYSATTYFVATVAVNAILAAANTAGLVLPLYGLVGFSTTVRQAAVFVCALGLMTMIGVLIGMAVGCFASSLDEARKLIIPILAPQMIFSGYVLPYKSLPSYFVWIYYASYWQYCLGLLQVNEFAERVFTEGCPASLVESTLYNDLSEWLEQHHLRNTTLPPMHFYANCSGTTSLQVTLHPPLQPPAKTKRPHPGGLSTVLAQLSTSPRSPQSPILSAQGNWVVACPLRRDLRLPPHPHRLHGFLHPRRLHRPQAVSRIHLGLRVKRLHC